MTPIWRFHARWLSSTPLVWVMTTLTYALIFAPLIYSVGPTADHIIYIDLQEPE